MVSYNIMTVTGCHFWGYITKDWNIHLAERPFSMLVLRKLALCCRDTWQETGISILPGADKRILGAQSKRLQGISFYQHPCDLRSGCFPNRGLRWEYSLSTLPECRMKHRPSKAVPAVLTQGNWERNCVLSNHCLWCYCYTAREDYTHPLHTHTYTHTHTDPIRHWLGSKMYPNLYTFFHLHHHQPWTDLSPSCLAFQQCNQPSPLSAFK